MSEGASGARTTGHEPQYLASSTLIQYPLADDWAHPGICVAGEGTIVIGAPSGGALLFFDGNGTMVGAVDVPTTEVHGVRESTRTCAGGATFWIADCGRRLERTGGTFEVRDRPGAIIRVSTDGTLLQQLHPGHVSWRPTATAESSAADAIWVADGYGSNRLYRFSTDGELVGVLNPDDSGFATPHDLLFWDDDTLLVTDRDNHRIVVLDAEGTFVREFRGDRMVMPCGLARFEDTLFVADLEGRVLSFDSSWRLIRAFGLGGAVGTPGWPNALDADGRVVERDIDGADIFRTAHSVAADQVGNLYVTEFSIGSRVVALVR